MLLFFSSCGDVGLESGDSFYFGTYAGFCAGDCWTVFLISNNEVYPDDFDPRDNRELTFSNNALPSDKFEIAEEVRLSLPDILSTSSTDVYGCPDCADQGGIIIGWTKGGTSREIRIDPFLNDEDLQEIIDYANQIRDAVEELRS